MRRLFIFLCCCYLPSGLGELMLLKNYEQQDIKGWVMSEKLDGVRGFWNGKDLISRQGYSFNAPDFFIKDFPPFAIDGEIYSSRGEFDLISSIVRGSDKIQWQHLKLHVFDVPYAKGNLFERLGELRRYLADNPSPYIEIIEQIAIVDRDHLRHFFESIQQAGGEGVVVRNPQALYERGRSDSILKLKAIFDDECTVIAHIEGKGKYQGKLGSIVCKNQYGEFKIGSGFSDYERANPPPIGTLITYKYRGFSAKGKPRFATYYRVRSDMSP